MYGLNFTKLFLSKITCESNLKSETNFIIRRCNMKICSNYRFFLHCLNRRWPGPSGYVLRNVRNFELSWLQSVTNLIGRHLKRRSNGKFN